MKYSIIIPTLNEEKLLPNLFKQLNDSGFRKQYNTQVIISDGGSIDKTVDIAAKSAEIVKVHNHSSRQNIAEGRNEGAKYATGELFVFINADIIFPDIISFFSHIDNVFKDNSILAMTCVVKVFPEEEILSDKIFHNFYNTYFKLLNSIGIGMGRGECQVIRREVFTKASGYNEHLAAGEDFDLFRRIRKTGKIYFSETHCVYESPRRYRKLGYSGVTWSWFKNGISVLFKNKSISKEWEQVR